MPRVKKKTFTIYIRHKLNNLLEFTRLTGLIIKGFVEYLHLRIYLYF